MADVDVRELIELAKEAGRANGRLDEINHREELEAKAEERMLAHEEKLEKISADSAAAVTGFLSQLAVLAQGVILKVLEVEGERAKRNWEVQELRDKMDTQHKEFHARLARLAQSSKKAEDDLHGGSLAGLQKRV
jgi:hypothetical protein